jgi:integrase
MKTDKEHRVPLTDKAIALLEALPKRTEFVFPSAINPKKTLSNMAMAMVLQRMGLRQKYTVHGFRSTFRDWVHEETDYQREIAELALAHQVGSEVERSYRRGDALDKRRKLMEDWSAYLG